MSYRPFLIDIEGDLLSESPVRSGAGERWSPVTDSPLLRKNGGVDTPAVFSGTSLRGILRAHLSREESLLGCAPGAVDRLFGNASGNSGNSTRGEMPIMALDRLFGNASGNSGDQSRLTFWDAVALTTRNADIRDHVRISPLTGAAEDGGKFDEEIQAPSTAYSFHCRFEGEAPSLEARSVGAASESTDELILLSEAVRALEAGELRAGSGSARGYGRIRLARTQVRAWNRAIPEELAGWLRYRLGDKAAPHNPFTWPSAKLPDATAPLSEPQPWNSLTFHFALQCEGPVLIKDALLSIVSTMAEGEKRTESGFYRYNGQPCLPGSTLRGWLRGRAERIRETTGLHGEAVGRLFGEKKDSVGGGRSLLEVSDGSLRPPVNDSSGQNNAYVKMDHVALDRITSFPAKGSLFSANALASPCFDCRIHLRFSCDDAAVLNLWALLLRDLVEGYRMWIGSGATRGYGKVLGCFIEKLEGSIVKENVRCRIEQTNPDYAFISSLLKGPANA